MSITITDTAQVYSTEKDPVPVLVDAFHAIYLAGRLNLLQVPADEAWGSIITASIVLMPTRVRLRKHASPAG